MQVFTPSYYHRFRCLAADCPDSCCKEWEVDIDPETAARYQRLSGSLGDDLRQVLRTDEAGNACMTIQNGRCPMWREDGLCRIHAELGHNALSRTCREYPRIRHDYGTFTELGLELSCPEAARLILSSDYTMVESTTSECGETACNPALLDTLLHSRREALAFLECSPLPLPQRLAVLLLYAYDVQNEIDGGDPAVLTPQENLSEAVSYGGVADLSLFAEFFSNLEILTPRWRERLSSLSTVLRWNEHHMALVRYLIYRYWLQAVSDYDLVCRVKFILLACILVCALGGDTVSTAQLFSKEIENDPDNLEAILDGAYTAPAFTDVHLLSILLNS